jgi:hypothetical protein
MAPDLTISEMIVQSAGPISRIITARVANAGVLPTTSVSAVFRKDSPTGDLLQSFTIPSIAPGAYQDVSFTWVNQSPNDVQVLAVVDEPNTVDEFDETNNSRGTTAPAAVLRTLSLSVGHASWGSITIDPNDPNYAAYTFPLGKEVTLTAIPVSGKRFESWTIYDPNHPGDVFYSVQDTNSVLHLTMNANWEVEAKFNCGTGVASVLPLLAIGMLSGLKARRRKQETSTSRKVDKSTSRNVET